MTASRFWLVVNPDPMQMQAYPPTFKHQTYDSARAEAFRLARLHPDEQFHVMSSALAVMKSDVQEVEFSDDLRDTDKDVPF